MTALTGGLDPWRGRPPGWPERVRELTRIKARRRGHGAILTDADIEDAASQVNLRIVIEIKLRRTYPHPEATLEARVRDVLTDFIRAARRRALREVLAEHPPEGAEAHADDGVRECLRCVVSRLWEIHDAFLAAYEAAVGVATPNALATARRRLDAVLKLLAEIWPELAPDLSREPSRYREGVAYHAETIRLALCRACAACRLTGYCERPLAFGDAQDAKRSTQDVRRSKERGR